MINILRKVLGLCEHSYETIEVATNVVYRRGKPIPVGNIYYQECRKCHKIRKYIL